MFIFHLACHSLFDEYEIKIDYNPSILPEHFKFANEEHGLWGWMWGAACCIKSCLSVSSGRGDWPADTRDYLYYKLFESIEEPKKLECRDKDWADAFHVEHGTRGVIHLRDHPFVPNQRNSNPQAWRGFLDYIKEPVILIGDVDLKHEKAISARHLPHDKQFALIGSSKWYMGAASGPAVLAHFCGVPNKVFSNNQPVPKHKWRNEDGSFQFGPYNKWMSGTETAEQLQYEYESWDATQV